MPEVPAGLGFASYPNPTSGELTITASVHRPGPVRITVVDLLGRERSVVHSGRLQPGDHRFRWLDRRLPAGAYFLRLESADGVAVRPVTRVR